MMPPSVEYQPPHNDQQMADRGMKRSLAPGTLPKQPKKPRLIRLDPRVSPLQYLNTMRPGLDFKVERHADQPEDPEAGGVPPDPRFSVSVIVDGCMYEAEGKGKQHAKQLVAVQALRVMLNDPTLEYIEPVAKVATIKLPRAAKAEPTASVETPADPGATTANANATATTASTATPAAGAAAPSSTGSATSSSTVGKTPVQILHEKEPSAVYECTDEDPVNFSRRFTISVTVQSGTYRGFGANKKQAKQAAARSALIAMGTPVEGLFGRQQNGGFKGGKNFQQGFYNRGQQQGQHQGQYMQQQQQHIPVTRKSSNLLNQRFVPGQRNWQNKNSGGNGNQANYLATGQAVYQSGQSNSGPNQWYGYDRSRGAGVRGAATAMVQGAAVAGTSSYAAAGAVSGAVPQQQQQQQQQQQAWGRTWPEHADWQQQQQQQQQYSNNNNAAAYWGNGEMAQGDVGQSGYYQASWDYGYAHDANAVPPAVVPTQGVAVPTAHRQHGGAGGGGAGVGGPNDTNSWNRF